MELKNARGTRDISGEDAILRTRVVDTLKGVFELYGYNPLETPSLERYETLASKYAGGEEILKEVFKLRDQGNRELALRYDLTVPLARFIASNPTLKMPFKRYAVGNVFRDGPLKMGRYREFAQCDVDVVGSSSMASDAEMIKIALSVFEKLDLNVVVKVNNRKILDSILEKADVKKEDTDTVMLSIDKLEKFGKETVEKELAGKGITAGVIVKLITYLSIEGTNKQKIEKLGEIIGGNRSGLDEIEEVLKFSGNKNVEVDAALARGLTYYTGTVFEVFLKGAEIKSSVAAGGRYDNMIGNFVQEKRDYPAVGISFGVDVISDSIKLESEERGGRTVVKALVISIGEAKKASEVVEELRSKGINCDADYSGKVGKAIEYANTYKIPYVLFVGKKEVKASKIKVRNMDTGNEEMIAVTKLADSIK